MGWLEPVSADSVIEASLRAVRREGLVVALMRAIRKASTCCISNFRIDILTARNLKAYCV